MPFLQKIKLLFKANKPATELVGELKEAKRGWRTLTFWVSLVGTLVTLVGAVKAVIPATAALVIITGLNAAYSILRGAQKFDTDTNRGPLQSTEVWMTGFGEVSKALAALQTGGLNAPWVASALSIVNMVAAAAGQFLASQPKAQPPEA